MKFWTNLKTRIKRALAGFLREELLEYIGYNHRIPYMPLNERFVVHQTEFDTMVMEQIIPITPDPGVYPPDPRFLEEFIHDCKKRFADQVLDHIHVEEQNLTDRSAFMQRSVKFVLRVQRKQD